MRNALALLLTLLPGVAWAQEHTLDDRINAVMEPIADVMVGFVFADINFGSFSFPWIVLWLIAGAVFFTLYFGFVNVRGFGHAIRLVRGDYDDPNDAGEVTHFQALATALSGTVGLGNIAGVAVAVSLGGPGATFWMIVAGLLGMSTKFVECTLGVKYRVEHADGSVSGGPMYYLSQGLANRGMPGIGKLLAFLFCTMCILGGLGAGNLFQVNQAYTQIVEVTGGADSFFAERAWLFGVIVAALVGMVIIGGIKSIARVTATLVPLMAVMYLAAGAVVIAMNLDAVPGAFMAIINGAFSPEGMQGGFIGVLIQGFRRAAFSNEAGLGSAAIAHSAVRTNEPLTEGHVALLEPFIDTVVICTMTALVIIITGQANQEGLGGIQLTSAAFASAISWFPYLLAVAAILFALSTAITWAYYSTKCWCFMVGETRRAALSFQAVYLAVLVVGATMSLGKVVDLADSLLFTMALANIAGLYIMAPEVKRDLKAYRQKLADGTIKPVKGG